MESVTQEPIDDPFARFSEDELNFTLQDVVWLLEREIARLKTALDAYRLIEHPRRRDIVRWYVERIDERQDRLEQMRAAIRAQKGIH